MGARSAAFLFHGLCVLFLQVSDLGVGGIEAFLCFSGASSIFVFGVAGVFALFLGGEFGGFEAGRGGECGGFEAGRGGEFVGFEAGLQIFDLLLEGHDVRIVRGDLLVKAFVFRVLVDVGIQEDLGGSNAVGDLTLHAIQGVIHLLHVADRSCDSWFLLVLEVVTAKLVNFGLQG